MIEKLIRILNNGERALTDEEALFLIEKRVVYRKEMSSLSKKNTYRDLRLTDKGKRIGGIK